MQLPWPWQRASASSLSSTAHRRSPAASRESRTRVNARFSAAGPGKRSLWATIVQADTHIPQPMHSMAVVDLLPFGRAGRDQRVRLGARAPASAPLPATLALPRMVSCPRRGRAAAGNDRAAGRSPGRAERRQSRAARPALAAVDDHRTRAAHADPAGVAEGQRGVLAALDATSASRTVVSGPGSTRISASARDCRAIQRNTESVVGTALYYRGPKRRR